MKYLIVALTASLWMCAAASGQTCGKIASYLYEPSYCLDHTVRGKARAYVPQPGDVMLATDSDLFWKITHNMALAGEPHNSAIVVQRRDGTLALLEAGPNDTLWVGRTDLLPHLKEYADKGPVWIRKRKTPLTPAQNCALMEFAERQDGKRFALGRMGILLTPLRERGPLRTEFMGKPHGDRASYYCSELAIEACVAADLIDRATARPGASFPHDLFFDHSHNRYINKHLPLVHDWEPPARWMDHVVGK